VNKEIMIEVKETFESRVSRLANYLTRAYKYNKPSILFAMYLSEFLRSDVEKSLKSVLVEHGLEVVSVDAKNNKDLPAFFSAMNSDNTVFFAHNMEKGFPDALQYLNFKREELVEHHVKAVFWVREEELARISLDAPDFFAFRNRVVEFMEVPTAEERRPALVVYVLETEYKSRDEIKRSIELKEKLLSELSAEDEISGYLLFSLGNLYYQIGSYKKSIEYTEKALKIAQDIGDRQNEGPLLGNLGLAYYAQGQVERAIEYHKQALTIAKEIGDRRNEGNRLGYLGTAYRSLGQVRRAIGYSEQAFSIAKEIGDRGGEGKACGDLGNAYYLLGDVKRAIEYYEQALTIFREIGDRRDEGDALGNLGTAYRSLGQVERAIEYHKQALTIDREIGDRGSEGNTLGNIGNAYYSLGKIERAMEYYEQALKIAQDVGDRRGEGTWLGSFGGAYYSLGKVERAIEYYEQALKIVRDMGDRKGEGAWLNNLGVAFMDLKKYDIALACYLSASKIHREIRTQEIGTETNINELKNKIGKEEFQKLMDTVEPKAEEIVQGVLGS
jgi:tetratricopeptide (TPR) repeat protein